MAEVVCKARGIDEIGVAAERPAELAPDLRALQRVGQPRAREIARADGDDLRLCRQPPQGGAVEHPGAVPHKGPAPTTASEVGALWWLLRPPGGGLAVIPSHTRS